MRRRARRTAGSTPARVAGRRPLLTLLGRLLLYRLLSLAGHLRPLLTGLPLPLAGSARHALPAGATPFASGAALLDRGRSGDRTGRAEPDGQGGGDGRLGLASGAG